MIMNNRNVLEVLEKALERVETGWTKGAPAHDDKGLSTGYNDTNACKWCLWGAICNGTYQVMCNDREEEAAFKIVSDVIHELFTKKDPDRSCQSHVIHFNDSPNRVVEQVKSVLGAAIADAQTGVYRERNKSHA